MAGLDDDMVAPMAAFAGQIAEMELKVVAPLLRVDPDVAATFTPLRQAALSLACAFTAITAYKVYRQVNNLPPEDQVELKLQRVQAYIKKVREISEIEVVKAQGATDGDAFADGVERSKKGAKKARAAGPKIDKAATLRIVHHHAGVGKSSAPS